MPHSRRFADASHVGSPVNLSSKSQGVLNHLRLGHVLDVANGRYSLLCSTTFRMLVMVLAMCQKSALAWNLTSDFSESSNPNGAWEYGYMSGAQFVRGVQTTYVVSSLSFTAWGNGDGVFIFKQTLQVPSSFGISHNHVSLECDFGVPAVQWTAPTTDTYTATIATGGQRCYDNFGGGNANAAQVTVALNGTVVTEGRVTRGPFCGCIGGTPGVLLQSFTATLPAGSILLLSLPQQYGCGNTEVDFNIDVLSPSASLASSASQSQTTSLFQLGTSSVSRTLSQMSTTSQSQTMSPSQLGSSSRTASPTATGTLSAISSPACFNMTSLLSSSTDWTLGSAAAWYASSPNGQPGVQLNPAAPDTGGTILWQKPVSIKQGLDVTFDVQFGATSSPPADAVSFVLYETNSAPIQPWACDHRGGGGCLDGATRFALVFKTYDNNKIYVGIASSDRGLSGNVNDIAKFPLDNIGRATQGLVLGVTLAISNVTSSSASVKYQVSSAGRSYDFGATLDLLGALNASPTLGNGEAWLGFAASTAAFYQAPWISSLHVRECQPSDTLSFATSTTQTQSSAPTSSRTSSQSSSFSHSQSDSSSQTATLSLSSTTSLTQTSSRTQAPSSLSGDNCPTGWTAAAQPGSISTCFKRLEFTDGLDRGTARATCVAMGADLALVSTTQELAFVFSSSCAVFPNDTAAVPWTGVDSASWTSLDGDALPLFSSIGARDTVRALEARVSSSSLLRFAVCCGMPTRAWVPGNEWGSCSATCGEGVRLRPPACHGPFPCVSPIPPVETQTCGVSNATMWMLGPWTACAPPTHGSLPPPAAGCYPPLRARNRSFNCVMINSCNSEILNDNACAGIKPPMEVASCDAVDGGACCMPPCDRFWGEPEPSAPVDGSAAACALPACLEMRIKAANASCKVAMFPTAGSMLGGDIIRIKLGPGCPEVGSVLPLVRYGCSNESYAIANTSVHSIDTFEVVTPAAEEAAPAAIAISWDAGVTWREAGEFTFVHPLNVNASAWVFQAPSLRGDSRGVLGPNDPFTLSWPVKSSTVGANFSLRIAVFEVSDSSRPSIVSVDAFYNTSDGTLSNESTMIADLILVGENSSVLQREVSMMLPCTYFELGNPLATTQSESTKPSSQHIPAPRDDAFIASFEPGAVRPLLRATRAAEQAPLPSLVVRCVALLRIDGAHIVVTNESYAAVADVIFPDLSVTSGDGSLHPRVVFIYAVLLNETGYVMYTIQTTLLFASHVVGGGEDACPIHPTPQALSVLPFSNATWGPWSSATDDASFCALLRSIDAPVEAWGSPPAAVAATPALCPLRIESMESMRHILVPAPDCPMPAHVSSSKSAAAVAAVAAAVSTPSGAFGACMSLPLPCRDSAPGEPQVMSCFFSTSSCDGGPSASCCYDASGDTVSSPYADDAAAADAFETGGIAPVIGFSAAIGAGAVPSRLVPFQPAASVLRAKIHAAWSPLGMCSIAAAGAPQDCPPPPSQTQTLSVTQSASQSPTSTFSRSHASSPSFSPESQSSSNYIVLSTSGSSSQTTTPSTTRSSSQITTPSTTRSSSQTATPSTTRSSSQIATPSTTRLSSQTAALSTTRSSSQTAPSQTAPSQTTPSQTTTPYTTPWSSQTATPSTMRSSSKIMATSAMLSSSRTTTPTLTLSPSNFPSDVPPQFEDISHDLHCVCGTGRRIARTCSIPRRRSCGLAGTLKAVADNILHLASLFVEKFPLKSPSVVKDMVILFVNHFAADGDACVAHGICYQDDAYCLDNITMSARARQKLQCDKAFYLSLTNACLTSDMIKLLYDALKAKLYFTAGGLVLESLLFCRITSSLMAKHLSTASDYKALVDAACPCTVLPDVQCTPAGCLPGAVCGGTSGQAVGDPHYFTSDGSHYDCQGIGTYLAAGMQLSSTSARGGGLGYVAALPPVFKLDWAVYSRYAPIYANVGATITTAWAAGAKNGTIVIFRVHDASADGKECQTNMSSLSGLFFIPPDGGMPSRTPPVGSDVVLADGKVAWPQLRGLYITATLDLHISYPVELRGGGARAISRWFGLLGNNDGISANDNMLPDGSTLTTPSHCNSWQADLLPGAALDPRRTALGADDCRLSSSPAPVTPGSTASPSLIPVSGSAKLLEVATEMCKLDGTAYGDATSCATSMIATALAKCSIPTGTGSWIKAQTACALDMIVTRDTVFALETLSHAVQAETSAAGAANNLAPHFGGSNNRITVSLDAPLFFSLPADLPPGAPLGCKVIYSIVDGPLGVEVSQAGALFWTRVDAAAFVLQEEPRQLYASVTIQAQAAWQNGTLAESVSARHTVALVAVAPLLSQSSSMPQTPSPSPSSLDIASPSQSVSTSPTATLSQSSTLSQTPTPSPSGTQSVALSPSGSQSGSRGLSISSTQSAVSSLTPTQSLPSSTGSSVGATYTQPTSASVSGTTSILVASLTGTTSASASATLSAGAAFDESMTTTPSQPCSPCSSLTQVQSPSSPRQSSSRSTSRTITLSASRSVSGAAAPSSTTSISASISSTLSAEASGMRQSPSSSTGAKNAGSTTTTVASESPPLSPYVIGGVGAASALLLLLLLLLVLLLLRRRRRHKALPQPKSGAEGVNTRNLPETDGPPTDAGTVIGTGCVDSAGRDIVIRALPVPKQPQPVAVSHPINGVEGPKPAHTMFSPMALRVDNPPKAAGAMQPAVTSEDAAVLRFEGTTGSTRTAGASITPNVAGGPVPGTVIDSRRDSVHSHAPKSRLEEDPWPVGAVSPRSLGQGSSFKWGRGGALPPDMIHAKSWYVPGHHAGLPQLQAHGGGIASPGPATSPSAQQARGGAIFTPTRKPLVNVSHPSPGGHALLEGPP